MTEKKAKINKSVKYTVIFASGITNKDDSHETSITPKPRRKYTWNTISNENETFVEKVIVEELRVFSWSWKKNRW